jgi:hypothetical protein
VEPHIESDLQIKDQSEDINLIRKLIEDALSALNLETEWTDLLSLDKPIQNVKSLHFSFERERAKSGKKTSWSPLTIPLHKNISRHAINPNNPSNKRKTTSSRDNYIWILGYKKKPGNSISELLH